jgi:hypothetical protein
MIQHVKANVKANALSPLCVLIQTGGFLPYLKDKN